MTSELKNAWESYLNHVVDRKTRSEQEYVYPVTNEETNTKLEQQDSEKMTTEQLMISRLLDWEWKIAIDFGCGTGAHFPLFDRSDREGCMFIGIDPDYSRAEIARETARKQLRWVESQVVSGGVEILENAPSGTFADVILCSQVLGHVSENQAIRILRGFNQILRQEGECVILVPVIGKAFKDDPTAGGWDGTADFIHLVDMNRSPGDKDYRMPITLNQFNKHADRPAPGILPVRSFLVEDFPNPYELKIPHQLDELPRTITNIIEDQFSMESAILYSIHRDRNDVVFPIGDLVFHLRKY